MKQEPENEIEFSSIGENCLGHDVIKRHGLKHFVTPFSHARSNIDFVRQLVETNFAEMLCPNHLFYKEKYGKQVVVNTLYSCDSELYDKSVSEFLEFTHHDVIGNVQARDSYRRKAERFLASLSGPGISCYVYHHRGHASKSIHRITKRLLDFRSYCRRVASRPVSVVMFTQELVDEPSKRGLNFEIRN